MLKRVFITFVLLVLVVMVYFLPEYYYRRVDEETFQERMEIYLNDKYDKPFHIQRSRFYYPDEYEVYAAPIDYSLDDSYYRAEAKINTLPFGLTKIQENWEGVEHKLEREEFFLEKAREIFGEKIILKEVSGLRTEDGYSYFPYVGKKELLSCHFNRSGQFELKLVLYIFDTINTEEELTINRKKIYEYIEFLKSKGMFEYAGINIYYLDQRYFAPGYQRYNEYIKESPLEKRIAADGSVYYLPSEVSRVQMSKALQSVMFEMDEVKLQDEIESLPRDILNFENLRDVCQYQVEIITIPLLKDTTYNNLKRYEEIVENDNLDQYNYDNWTKVKLQKNNFYMLEHVEESLNDMYSSEEISTFRDDLMNSIYEENLEKVMSLLTGDYDINFVNSYGDTPLMRAVDSQNIPLTKALLESRKISDLVTPLRSAVVSQSEEIVDLLLEYNPDISRTLLLREAEKTGNLNIVNKLIQAGTNIDILLEGGRVPLIYAVEENHPDTVRLLIEAGADINYKDEEGNNLLICAAYHGYNDIVSILLETEINIDERNDEGKTALMFAAENGCSEIVRNLINKGAYINAQSNDGSSVLDYALKYGDLESISVLKEAGARDDSWHEFLRAVVSNNIITVREFIEKGVNRNAADSNNNDALSYAVMVGNREIVKLLIEEGFDIEARNEDGVNALIVSVNKNNYAIVKTLLDLGADVNSTTNNDDTPLVYAIDKENIDMVRLLIERGADVNATCNRKITPLMHAAYRGNFELVKLLVEKGADVNSQADLRINGNWVYKKTPLMYAAENGDSEIVKLLIEAGAEVDYQSALRSPLKLAEDNGHSEIVEILERAMGE